MSLSMVHSRFNQFIVANAGRLFSSLLPNVMAALSNDFLAFQSHVCFLKTGAAMLEFVVPHSIHET